MSSSFLSLRFLFFCFTQIFRDLSCVASDSIPFLLDANVSIGDFLTAKFIRHWKLYFFLFLLFALPFSLCFTFRIFFLLFNLKIVDRSFVHWQKNGQKEREKKHAKNYWFPFIGKGILSCFLWNLLFVVAKWLAEGVNSIGIAVHID